MKALVFLPGIMGSELRRDSDNERVWPPSLTDIIFKNADVDALLEPGLHATRPIVAFAGFYGIYRSILNDIKAIGYTENGSEKRFISYPYDWRQPNQHTARKLAEHLSQQDSFEEIILLGHSMGGLVLRYMLESGEFEQEPWFDKISQLITLGTPHLGAAAAINQVAGLAGNLGMNAADIKRLTADTRYPSAYQLVPPRATGMCVTHTRHAGLPELVTPFADDIVNRYQLEPANIQAHQEFWQGIDSTRRPDHVNYFYFVGSAHKSMYKMQWNGQDLEDKKLRASGDGTVPISSAMDVNIPHSFSQKKHEKIFEDRRLRTALYRMLGAAPGVRPFSADDQVELGQQDAIGISTDQQQYAREDSLEVIISFAEPQEDPTLIFQIVRLDETQDDVVEIEVGEPIRMAFEGGIIESARFSINFELDAGVYHLKTASAVDDPEPTLFLVTEDEFI